MTLASRNSKTPCGSVSLVQPMLHYLFLDLDTLLSTAKTHVLAQPTVYPLELTQLSTGGIMLHPERLTALLDGNQQTALVINRSGSYFNESLMNAHALQAVGWNLKKKGALDHRTLEDMMERNLKEVGACSDSGALKTMVLATGELRPPIQSCIQAYLRSGWCVKLFCLQRCWKQAIDGLDRAHQGRFTVVHLDQHLKKLLTTSVPATSTKPKGSSLLSEMATNKELWNQVRVRRGSMVSPPHARALALAAASPRPSWRINHCMMNTSGVEDDPISRQEHDAMERRQRWLAKLPNVFTSGDRQRYVFLNLDNIAGALFSSHILYRRVDGAASPQDVRISFGALTQCLRGKSADVKCQCAGYSNTSPYLARALVDFGWTLKPLVMVGGGDKGLQHEMMLRLAEGASTINGKTLVLAMGDGGLGSTKANAYREIIGKFLEQRWYVEIYAWLHALNDGFLELQGQYPGCVVVKPLDENIETLVYPKIQERTRAFALAEPTRGFPNRYETIRKQNAVSGRSSIETSSIGNEDSEKIIAPNPSTWSELFDSSRRPVSPPLPPPQPTIVTLQQQIQQIQNAFAQLQSSVSPQRELLQQNEELKRKMREQTRAFEEERQRQAALLLQQTFDAQRARHLQLEKREESLVCPITCDLYEDPVTTVCCGKTFSAKVAQQLDECPWCRKINFSTHPNRDIANLVEQYRAERDALDAEEQAYDNEEIEQK